MKKTVRLQRNGRLLHKNQPIFHRLLSFEAITTRTAFRIARTRVPHVDLAKRAIIARTVVFTFGYTATNARVHFLTFFIHHSKKPPFLVIAVCAKWRKIIDICKNLL